MAIYFYSPRGKYGCFSNFSKHSVDLDGRVWPTSEHYFQAQKFVGTAYTERIRRAKTPSEAKKLAWKSDAPFRGDWDDVRDDVMRRVVMCKFSSHEDLRDILLSTGEEELIEKAPNDAYWGCGADGTGENKLGKILMEIRTLLREGA
ncbi:MAG: NADAR family protein [Myxococcales bacterium]|nr:NADAR family protein [Myxococcales bacterium]